MKGMHRWSAAVLAALRVLLVAGPAAARPVHPSAPVTDFLVPTGGARPYGITAGPDGALWFTEEDADLIGRITTDGGYTEYGTGTCCFPTEITSAGGFLWFTMEQGPSIVKMDTQRFVHTINYPDSSELAYAIATG